VLTTYLPIDARTISRLPRVRIIARYESAWTTSTVAAAAERAITVTNVPDYSVERLRPCAGADPRALRKLPQSDAKVRAGGWGSMAPAHAPPSSSPSSGWLPAASRAASCVLETLGGRVVAHDPYVGPADGLPPLLPLDQLLAQSDVSLSMRQRRRRLASDRPPRNRADARRVNPRHTSRGPLVDFGPSRRRSERSSSREPA